ncbi:carboxymuconolactone decarboxylase family protein [Parafrankia discariae]|uniref:carboxymuconolactone decarboxylase family protein n=1 Tax=Parafrankia discariae TaxID=365528 RepID=UPI00035D0F5D|nr:hypothetical protein [Parafrankia discariae]
MAARRECGYLWAQHLFAGRAAGLTDEATARVAYGPTAPFLTPVENALIRASDEVLDSGVVARATWDALTAELDVKQLLDVIFTVGCFATIKAFMNSVEIDVDPKIPDLLAR